MSTFRIFPHVSALAAARTILTLRLLAPLKGHGRGGGQGPEDKS